MKEMVKAAAADALAQLAARVILDMAPYIEEFMVNDLAPMLMDGVGAVGDFLAGVADSLHPDEMSPTIASTLPPKLPRSGFAENFSILANAILVYAETKTASNLLTFFNLGIGFTQRTDLEYIWIIPTLTER